MMQEQKLTGNMEKKWKIPKQNQHFNQYILQIFSFEITFQGLYWSNITFVKDGYAQKMLTLNVALIGCK